MMTPPKKTMSPAFLGAFTVLLLAGVGCSKDEPASPSDDTSEQDTTPTDTSDDTGTTDDTAPPTDDTGTSHIDTSDSGPTDTDTTGDTDTGGDTAPEIEVFDCAKAPALPEAETIIEGARGHKGLAFDAEGHIVGSDGSSLIKATYDGEQTVWIPGESELEQLDYLSGGDLVSTNGYGAGLVKRYTPEGGETVLASGLDCYSIIAAPNDMLFCAGWNGAYTIDPDSGEYTQFLTDGEPDFPRGVSARTLAFSRDFSELYIGTIDNSGRIYTLGLDKDYIPTGKPEVFAEGLGRGWHDGLDIDVCGNVYAVDYATSSLYRASSDGATVTTLADWSGPGGTFGHGLEFGGGLGGWRADAIYLPMPTGDKQVKEIVIGIPGNMWAGEVLNAP